MKYNLFCDSLWTLALLLLFSVTVSAVVSPCPKYFVFEPNKSQEDRWYGLITVESKIDLHGVTLEIHFDKSVIQLGNWLGSVKTNDDNTEFIIRNSEKKILANVPQKEEIFVVYDPFYDVEPPKLTKILLNGREICPKYEEQIDESKIPTIVLNINLPRCGTTIITSTPLITEGQYTTPGQWPWHAAIYKLEANKRKYNCGGTLISEKHVLTAAHCATERGSVKPLEPTELVIILGKYGLFVLGQNEQIRNVSKFSVHPGYNNTNFFNDIAIIHLESPVKFTKYVNSICLWEEDTTLESVESRIGTAVGWGRDHNNNVVTDLLMQARMPVIGKLSCIYAYREFYALFINDNNFCAGFANGTSVCNGDSGGGLVFPKKGSSGANTVWQIRGIVSNTVSRAGFICDPKYYVIFTDVAQYLKWIQKNIS